MAEQASPTAITEDDLKRRTGDFDLEAITFLDLSDQGLCEVGAVSLCISLRILNLSYNKLVNVRLVTSLVNLEELDLSANHITSLENFDKLEKLQRLDLPGNNLSQYEDLLPLCGLPCLMSLCLQLSGTTLTNPLCTSNEVENYQVFMSESFPNLQWLDGMRVGERGGGRGVRETIVELDQQLARAKSVGHPSTIDDITSKSPLNVVGDSVVSHSLNDDQAMQKITNLLTECSHTSQRVQEHIHLLKKELFN